MIEEMPVGTRVLVVEDEPRTARFVVDGLGVDGHEVVVAEDGEVGVFLAGTEHFDLFVLDLALLDESRLAILRGIRSAANGVPVVVLSECDDPGARDACKAAGAAAFLAKPLVVEDLRAAVTAEFARAMPRRAATTERGLA